MSYFTLTQMLQKLGLTVAKLTQLQALGATAATAAEVDQIADVSAFQETVTAAGALTLSKKVHKLAVVGGGAVTLAAPSANEIGLVKIIQMTTDDGDVTLALTNVVGQSSGTGVTFGAVGGSLTVIGGANSKWIVLKEQAVTLA